MLLAISSATLYCNHMKQTQVTPQHQVHPFPPLYNSQSRILILGSFPSVKSREAMFFYGHPQNRFWKLMGLLLTKDGQPPQTIPEKKALMLQNHIALWDTIASCDITGSSDSSISNVIANDFRPVLDNSRIQRIYCNGKTSHRLYMKYCGPQTGMDATPLPSTSPANAAWSLEHLEEAWRQILDNL